MSGRGNKGGRRRGCLLGLAVGAMRLSRLTLTWGRRRLWQDEVSATERRPKVGGGDDGGGDCSGRSGVIAGAAAGEHGRF